MNSYTTKKEPSNSFSMWVHGQLLRYGIVCQYKNWATNTISNKPSAECLRKLGIGFEIPCLGINLPFSFVFVFAICHI